MNSIVRIAIRKEKNIFESLCVIALNANCIWEFINEGGYYFLMVLVFQAFSKKKKYNKIMFNFLWINIYQ